MVFYFTVDNLSSVLGTAMGVTAQIKKKYAKVSATVMGVVRKSNRICPVVKSPTITATLRNSVAICGGVKVPQGMRSSPFSPGWMCSA